MTYNVWIDKFGPAAKNAAIVSGNAQRTKATWISGTLAYVPVNDGSQEFYAIDARDDNEAFAKLTVAYNAAHGGNRRPLSGKSYMRLCRAKGVK